MTVFVPHDPSRESATRYDSVFGPVDIWSSWRSTYKMLNRKKSGFFTGKALASETFIVTDKADALAKAKALFANRGKQFLGRNEPRVTKAWKKEMGY